MTVKGNHPLAETIAKELFGIETVPIEGVRRMVNKAARDAVAYHTAALTEYAEAQRKACAEEWLRCTFDELEHEQRREVSRTYKRIISANIKGTE